jgi:hypothetical protein
LVPFIHLFQGSFLTWRCVSRYNPLHFGPFF